MIENKIKSSGRERERFGFFRLSK